MLTPLIFSVFVVALLWGNACDGAVVVRPDVVRFAYVFDVADAPLAYDAVQLYVGLKAAEMQINAGGTLYGTNVSFDFYPAPSKTSSDAAKLAAVQAALQDNVTGFILSDWETTPAIYNVSNGTLPVIGARSLTEYEFMNPQFAFVNSFRMPIGTQYRMMLRHAFGAQTAEYSHFAVIARPSFPNISSAIRTTLRSFGYPDPVNIRLDADLSVLNTTAILDSWIQSGQSANGAFPLAGIFYTPAEDVIYILGNMSQDARFPFETMSFYTTDVSMLSSISHPTLGTTIFSKLYFVGNAFDPHDSSLAASVQYRSALATWITTNGTLPAALQPLAAIDSEPNLVSMEGYTAGMMLLGFLRHAPSITPQEYLNSVYSQVFGWIWDDQVGPFTNRCITTSDLTLPCSCNVGAPTLYINTVENGTGRVVRVDPSSAASQYLSMNIRGTACVIDDGDLPTPVPFQLYAPRTSSASDSAVWASHIFGMLRGLADAYNNGKYTPNVDFSASYMNSLLSLKVGSRLNTLSNTELLEFVYHVKRPFIVLGNWWDAADVTVPVINLNMAPDTSPSDPPFNPADVTQYTSMTWYLKPTFADLAHACSALLASLHAPSSVNVFVVSGNDTAATLAMKSLNTYQYDAVDVGRTNFSDSQVAYAVMRGFVAASSSASKLQVVVIASMSLQDVLVTFQALSDAVRDVAGDVPTAIPNLIVVAVCDLTFMYEVKFSLNTTLLATRFPIYFASYLYAFFEPTNSQRIAAATVLNTTDPALIEAPTTHAVNVIVGLFASVLMKFSASRPTPQQVLSLLYNQGVTSSYGVPFGPFYPSNCSATDLRAMEAAGTAAVRQCSCLKPLRSLNVFDFRGWLLNSAAYDPQFTFTMSTCGVVYSPLLTSSSLNVAMVAGIAAPCGTVAVCIVLYFTVFYGRRNNRPAPKDPNTPFAMVFTDIQSSTSLWARAPEAMAEALEQHHRLLRVLVSRHDGYEVKTIGDSFMVAFKAASSAAKFALDIQTTLFQAAWSQTIDDVYVALAAEAFEDHMAAAENKSESTGSPMTPSSGTTVQAAALQWQDAAVYAQNWHGIRVRVGMNWGLGSVKFDPVSQGYDYYGTLVNTAARVEGVGNGGQVLGTKDFQARLEEEGFNFDKVVVKPLGPQPLRGLDQPIPLFQLLPLSLATRQFGELRLDVEIEVETEEASSSNSATKGGDSASTSGAEVVTTWEGYLDRLIHYRKDAAAAREPLQRVMYFLHTALRTSPVSWQKETLKSLAKRWHIHLKPAPSTIAGNTSSGLSTDNPAAARKGASDAYVDKGLWTDLAQIVAKIWFPAEEARCQAIGSQAGTDSMAQRRRGSTASATQQQPPP